MKNRQKALTVAALALPLVLTGISLCVGVYHITPGALWKALTGGASVGDLGMRMVILNVRLPRTILALLSGAALAVSGAALQGLFRNPLVFEFSLGISYGAAFGAALSLIVVGRALPPQAAAFVFAVLAVLLVMAVTGRSTAPPVSILLAGIITSALFQALLSLVEFFSNPYALQSLIFWLMGSLGRAGWDDLAVSLPLVAAGTVVLIMMRWRVNVLSLGQDEARSLGVRVNRDRAMVIAAATLATAAATAVTGVINWVGLVVPHLVRLAVGPDNRKVIPLSALSGASLLLAADTLIRAASPFDFPIGILTSLVGIPFFIALLRRSGRIWQ